MTLRSRAFKRSRDKLYNIFTTTELMINKLGTIVTYVEGLLTIKSFNGLIK